MRMGWDVRQLAVFHCPVKEEAQKNRKAPGGPEQSGWFAGVCMGSASDRY